MIQLFITELKQQLSQTTLFEWLGVSLGILQVWFAKSNKPINYLFGIAGILVTIYVLLHAKLYAEILLHIYYLVMSVYGWLYWKNSSTQNQEITSSDAADWRVVIGICVVGFLVFYFGLVHLTDSDVPLWDSFVSCTAWAGMWLLAKRKIENWILLNISNFFAIPLLLHKGLALYALLTLFLFVMAFFGYFKWKKLLTKNNQYAY